VVILNKDAMILVKTYLLWIESVVMTKMMPSNYNKCDQKTMRKKKYKKYYVLADANNTTNQSKGQKGKP
jgi:hypothetical protein